MNISTQRYQMTPKQRKAITFIQNMCHVKYTGVTDDDLDTFLDRYLSRAYSRKCSYYIRK